MRGKVLTKLALVALLCASCGVMILPTFGEKSLKITFNKDVTADQIEIVKKKFSKGFILNQTPDNLSTKDKNQSVILTVKGYNLSAATMNEIKNEPMVENAKFEQHWAEKYFMAKKINLGLDLQGGMSLVLAADYKRMEAKAKKSFEGDEKKEITEQALERISNRINQFGVSEPSIRMKGVDAIEIQLPGVSDPEGVKTAIGTIGRVEYRLVDSAVTNAVDNYVAQKGIVIPELNTDQKILLDQIAADLKIPSTVELLVYSDRDKLTNQLHPISIKAVNHTVALAGDEISKAYQTTDDMQRLAVGFQLTADGAKKFAEITRKENWGKQLAICIDNKVRSYPNISNQIVNGSAIIQGNFTMEEVKILSRIINEGALPVDLQIVEERRVGPSLGKDAIESGVNSLLACALIIGVFMLIYYRVSGFLAIISLSVCALMMVSLLSMLGFTLTLPGIAGLVLTLGIAVDANVLIYERIREELRLGKSAAVAVEHGFARAFWTIFDSNITTILAAFILAQMETGPIKGFAVTLSVGIITSMISALVVAKIFFEAYLMIKKDHKTLSI